MSHQNYAKKTYLHIHTVLAALSSSFKTTWQIQRSSATRMNTGVCQNSGCIYINYFNKKIYIHTSFRVSVFLRLFVALDFWLLIPQDKRIHTSEKQPNPHRCRRCGLPIDTASAFNTAGLGAVTIEMFNTLRYTFSRGTACPTNKPEPNP